MSSARTAARHTYFAAQSVCTQTSPNSNVVTTPTYDLNNVTNLQFLYHDKIPGWVTLVAQSVPSVILEENKGLSTVKWIKGMTVTYNALDRSSYTVTLDGRIRDDGTVYRHENLVLGYFHIPDEQIAGEPELAAAELATATFDAPFTVDTLTSPWTSVVLRRDPGTPDSFEARFLYRDEMPAWTVDLPAGRQSALLADDRALGSARWKRGLSLHRRNRPGGIGFSLSGEILEAGLVYPHRELDLGTFPSV